MISKIKKLENEIAILEYKLNFIRRGYPRSQDIREINPQGWLIVVEETEEIIKNKIKALDIDIKRLQRREH